MSTEELFLELPHILTERLFHTSGLLSYMPELLFSRVVFVFESDTFNQAALLKHVEHTKYIYFLNKNITV